MKPFFWCLGFLLLASTSVFAQEFFIQNGSKLYDARLKIMCEADGTCSGPATVKVYKKNTDQLIKTFHSNDMFMMIGDKKVNVNHLYDEQSGIFFDDFNFDGTEDIAIQSGNDGRYGSPQYDIFFYNQTQKAFVKSKDLTNLASTSLGMFEVNSETKRLITFNKSGAAWHQTQEYAVVPNQGLKLVYEVTEDASGGEKVKVTERTLKKIVG